MPPLCWIRRLLTSGGALGISLHKEFDGQGDIVPGTLQSGQFTATVKLDATFGANARLGGMIYDFKGGANVDPTWTVRLVDVTAFDRGL